LSTFYKGQKMSTVFKDASISPDEILAGDSTEFSIKVNIGSGYTKEASRLVFDFSSTLGTSCPTQEVNEASGYIETYVSNPDVTYKTRCWDLDYKHYVDREHKPSREAMRMVVVDLDGGLKEGDTVELRWGETLGGFGPGAKVTTVIPRPDYKARVDIRYFDSQEKGIPDHGRDYIGYTRPVPDYLLRLEYTIIPRTLKRSRLIRKTDKAMLVPYDVFWNIAKVDDLSEIYDCSADATKNEQGIFEFADKNVQVVCKKADYSESASMDNVFEGKNIYWGDIHTHSAYSIDCAQRSGMDMTPERLMKFARDRAALDFYAVTDHHEPHHDPINHIGKDKWLDTMQAVNKMNVEGSFLVFPGIEFRNEFGDICLVFNDEPDYDDITRPELAHVSEFAKTYEGKMLAIPHFHGPGSEPVGTWRKGIENVCPVLEIYSDHGSYERVDIVENGRAWCKTAREDRCADFFLKNGYRYGIVANSDDHKGHIGVNGLTAVYAENLTREAIFDAYFKRHVYGTTNARIRLLFTGNDKLMGSVLNTNEPKKFFIDVVGEKPLKMVELFRNGDFYKRFYPQGISFKTEFTAPERGKDNWYVRATQLDNHIAYSSPVWYED